MQLNPDTYDPLDKKIQNAQSLFSEKNIELEVKEDQLVTQYYEITGSLTEIWDGKEKNNYGIAVLFTRPQSNYT